MREHARQLIDRARRGTDARRARGYSEETVEQLASYVIALARSACAIHMAKAAKHRADVDSFPMTEGVSRAERKVLIEEDEEVMQ